MITKKIFKNVFMALIIITFAISLPLQISAQEPDTATTDAAKSIDISVALSQKDSVNDITNAVTDSSYDTTKDISNDSTLTITSNEDMYGIYILWSSEVYSYTIKYEDKTINCDNGYLHYYTAIPEGTKSISINLTQDMSVSDIYAYSNGVLPSDVQIWQPSLDNDTDILVFSTHADDEILFLGGILTYYGGELGLNIQVAYMCNFFLTEPIRQHEELDGLWTCGITHYPVKADFEDLYSLDLETAMSQYNYDDIVSYATSCLRRFKPFVCVSQDFNGEYGHGNHRIFAKAISDAIVEAGNASSYTDSADKYGVWDVPKTYYHLYNDNTITLDVDTPLSHFDGKTSVQVLKEAFQKHVSQISYSFNVMDSGYAKTYWGNFNMRDFGLYRTTVGYDTGNDIMENVSTYRAERIAQKEKEEQQQKALLEAATANDEDNVSEDTDTSDNQTSKMDTRQLIITLAAILIIGVVIGGQAYRTQNLYKKKYNENKEDFEAHN